MQSVTAVTLCMIARTNSINWPVIISDRANSGRVARRLNESQNLSNGKCRVGLAREPPQANPDWKEGSKCNRGYTLH